MLALRLARIIRRRLKAMLRDNSDNGGRRQVAARNVLGEPLDLCSFKPMTGFYRDGCCNTGQEDIGSHTVCAVMTSAFLEYSKSRGNDLSTPMPELGFPGLKPGDRWCLCAPRWQEAFEAGQGASRGVACHPRGRSGLLCARQSQTLCGGSGLRNHRVSRGCFRSIRRHRLFRCANADREPERPAGLSG